jgi:hypothetical protein
MLNGSLGQISNRATWINGFEVIDAETDDFMDLTGVTITMKVARDPGGSVVLTGSTTTGELTIPGTGLVDWRFEASQMQSLCAGTYAAVVRFERAGDTDDVFLGAVAVLESF